MAFASEPTTGVRSARSPRRRVVLRAALEMLGGNRPVEVKNLSCTGALIKGEALPGPGRELILKAAGLDCFARVVWSDGHRCGLEFDEPLSSSQVLHLHMVTPEAVRSAELDAAAEWFRSQGRYARM